MGALTLIIAGSMATPLLIGPPTSTVMFFALTVIWICSLPFLWPVEYLIDGDRFTARIGLAR